MELHNLAAEYLAAKEAESQWTARRRELATAIQQERLNRECRHLMRYTQLPDEET